MSVENEVTMSDDAISAIAKLLQVAILTGTDIVDNLRMIRLAEDNNELYLDPEYSAIAEQNEKKMLEEAQKLAKQMDN